MGGGKVASARHSECRSISGQWLGMRRCVWAGPQRGDDRGGEGVRSVPLTCMHVHFCLSYPGPFPLWTVVSLQVLFFLTGLLHNCTHVIHPCPAPSPQAFFPRDPAGLQARAIKALIAVLRAWPCYIVKTARLRLSDWDCLVFISNFPTILPDVCFTPEPGPLSASLVPQPLACPPPPPPTSLRASELTRAAFVCRLEDSHPNLNC